MGQWTIVIQGTGWHHNRDLETDANRMTARFVEELEKAGHSIDKATFTHGSRDLIFDPHTPIDSVVDYERSIGIESKG